MKKTIKSFAVILISLMLVMTFAACGQGGNAGGDKPVYKIGICNYVPNASLDQIEENIVAELERIGEEKGVIEDTQAEMINNIFEFDDIDAGDIMTHRVDMTAVSADLTIEEFIAELGCISDYKKKFVY